MKRKIASFVSTGIVAVVVVFVSDLFSVFSLGSFAWVAFILWNFTAKGETKIKKVQMLTRIILGLPIGLLLAICMIRIPTIFGNEATKYLIAFSCNGIAVMFPSSIVPGIFFGIAFTFSGLGSGIIPNKMEIIVIMFIVMVIFSALGMVAAWLTEKLESM